MRAWKVTITQTLEANTDSPRDGSFTEYVQTLTQAKHIIGRFAASEIANNDYGWRIVSNITIEAIHVQMESEQ